MKKIKITLFALLTLTMINCSDDFLDKVQPDTINTGNYPKTAEELITMVNGAYQPLQWPKLYNMRMWTTDIFAGNSIVGAGGGDDGIETTQLSNFVTSTDNQGVLDLWRGPWPGILSSNIVIKTAPTLNIDDAVKNRSLGEAYFLRSHYYFVLVRFFGDVPIVTEPQDVNGDLYPARSPKADVYNLIISDLEKAIQLLPTKQTYGDADKGRASKGAAIGQLAKVYLTLGNWQKVVELTTQLEGMGYSLNADYSNNFNVNTENSVESLFEVQYASDGNYDFWGNQNQASWASPFMGPRGSNFVGGGGYGWNQPTQEFVDSYEAGDNRKEKSIFYEGCPQYDGKDYKASYSLTGYNVRKFLVPLSAFPSYNNSPLNFPVMRYSEVLLMKAEALNELGQTAQAAVPLNLVRARAGLSPVSGLSQTAFRDKVLHERRIELAFEGQRWFDLVRVNNGQYGLNFLHSIGKSNASNKHLLLPIPQIERDRNPNLTQNPGY